MEQSLALAEAAQRGDIEALYRLLWQKPYLLEDIDKIPFVDTPLHRAASAGCTHFAIEILGLKPSFAKKLNADGYSPIDLALTNRQTQTVKQLIRHDPELIRVKSKERFTPLHYVAKMDNDDLLTEFLVSCPKSIEDLTVRGETAVHIAVRYGKMRALKVLLGWLSGANLEQILNWQDDKGDTVLHIATSTNNLEAVNLIMKTRKIKSYTKNVEGSTALDIATRLPNAQDNGNIAKRLRGGMISEASFLKKNFRRFVLPLIKGSNGNNTASYKNREALLVVLALIATATYQAILTPPSVFTQNKGEANNLKSFFRLLLANNSSGLRLLVFLLLNSATFMASIFLMCFLFNADGLSLLVKVSLMYLVICYGLVMHSYFPLLGSAVLVIIPCLLFPILILVVMSFPIVRKLTCR